MPAEHAQPSLTVDSLRQDDAALRTLLGGDARAADALPVLAEQWWSRFGERSDLHPTLLATLTPVAAALATAFADEKALSRTDHPCWSWLRLLHRSAIGFQPELGRGGERLLADLNGLVAQIGRDGWRAALDALSQHWQREQERLDKLEQRLEAAERGQWQARQAQQQAARQLNRSMGGRPLPAAAVEFLQGEWYQELQWCLLTHGEQSDAWQRRSSLTDALVASLQPPANDGARQPLYDLIAEVGPALRELLGQRIHDGARLDQQLGAIEQQHLRLLRGDTPQTAPYSLIDNPEQWLEATALSSELMAPLQQLAAGDWLLDSAADERRIKLARKLEPWQQLLFVNRLGARVELLGAEALAFRLAVGDLRPLAAADCVDTVTQALLQQLIDGYQLQQRQRAEAQRLAEARERAEQQAQEAAAAATRERARQKALAEAAAAAARQAEAEALRAAAEQQRLDEERRQREEALRQQALARQQAEQEQQRQQQAREQEQARRLRITATGDDEQRRREARRAISLLTVGDWLELRDELGNGQRLKLAVKLPSSGRLLLVDREGIKRADLTGDELIERLATGAATLLANAPRFEDTLARVVDGLRRERGPRE